MGVMPLPSMVGGGEVGCPRYRFTKRTGDFTSRNGGWSKDGFELYNKLYKMVKDDRQSDNGAFGKVYRKHRADLCGKKRKRRNANGDSQQNQLAICDDLEQLLNESNLTAV
jgi:hypothetical protein